MTHFCKYHPLEAAAWHCPSCRILCCDQCSPDKPGDAKGAPHFCTLCGGELKYLGAAHGAVPCWQRPIDFLRYPLSPPALALLGLGAILPFVLEDGPLLFALGAFLLLASNYAYTVLEYAASGRLEPLQPGQVTQAENTEMALRAGLLLLAAAA